MNFPRSLSKSKLVAFRQCPKRLWLEVHQPDRRQDSLATQAVFKGGHEVGTLAQRLYDPERTGQTIDFKSEGLKTALLRTQALLKTPQPIFEAGFSAGGALAFADVMLPVFQHGKLGWRMVEVKSSTSVKAYQDDDVAIQSYVAMSCGVHLRSVSIAHIDSAWLYPGGGDYEGFLVEVDRTKQAFGRHEEVRAWIKDAQAVASRAQAPELAMGEQCQSPFACSFLTFCSEGQPTALFPVEWLPRVRSRQLKDHIREARVTDMRDVPSSLLNDIQNRVAACTVKSETYFDAEGARQALSQVKPPVYFLDFETIQHAVPRWLGTRPFEMIPFQFSVHCLTSDGTLSEHGFMDLTGNDPSQAFAEALVDICSEQIPIFVYNAGFEGARLAALAQRFVSLRQPLLAMQQRLVDLLPICQGYYYNPSQQGSWSIKKVLPTIAPQLDYAKLEGVQDGTLAMQAYLEAVDTGTSQQRKATIQQALRAYCSLDTLAMVELWRFLMNVQPTNYIKDNHASF